MLVIIRREKKMSFSLNACYAALKTVKAQNVDEAFNVMIIALIESKRYQ